MYIILWEWFFFIKIKYYMTYDVQSNIPIMSTMSKFDEESGQDSGEENIHLYSGAASI